MSYKSKSYRSVWAALGIARPPYNRFTGPRIKSPADGRFMWNRQNPGFWGWRDRMSGIYYTKHNKVLRDAPDGEAKL